MHDWHGCKLQEAPVPSSSTSHIAQVEVEILVTRYYLLGYCYHNAAFANVKHRTIRPTLPIHVLCTLPSTIIPGTVQIMQADTQHGAGMGAPPAPCVCAAAPAALSVCVESCGTMIWRTPAHIDSDVFFIASATRFIALM